jgi:phosphate:Na+ symporter
VYKKLLYPFFLVGVGALLFSNSESKVIIAGIAIFLIGMLFMDEGFKLFSGGILERILEKSTNTLSKAVATGFAVTSVVQSSSLITVIIISFLSAGLMSLSSAIGVIFGSNIGTTSTAWIVSSFGVKIDIATYAMPMLIFGVLLRLNDKKGYQGFGNILVGLGFIFLGIDYMKDGFESFKEGIDLAQYALGGLLGALLFVTIGIVATVVIQSSSATVALIITALAAGQIEYMNALELAIGANIGTTITAIVASMTSNSNGKRLALAHLIFNFVTAGVALVFLIPLAYMTDSIAVGIGIGHEDYAMKLSLFHTVFNVLGVLLVTPFTAKLVRYLEGKFVQEEASIERAKYLDKVVVTIPDAALAALRKEVIHLYDNATEGFAHALSLHRHTFYGKENIPEVVSNSTQHISTNIDLLYNTKIKALYGDIIHFTVMAEQYFTDYTIQTKAHKLKNASRNIVEALKAVKEIQKNIARYENSENKYLKAEYNFIRSEIAKTLDTIYALQKNGDDLEVISKLEVLKEDIKHLDLINNGKIDHLIRENKIDTNMATSIINDSTFAYDVIKRLIRVATILWINDKTLQEMGEQL